MKTHIVPASADVTVHDGVAVTEASTIGLAPGQWPRVLMLDGVRLAYSRTVSNGEELGAVVYGRPPGIEVHVLND